MLSLKILLGGDDIMTKYHINKHGVPSVCRATKGNCPLGGEGEHFSTEEEAQKHADSLNEKEYEFLPTNESLQRNSFDNYYYNVTEGGLQTHSPVFDNSSYIDDDVVKKVFEDEFGENSYFVEVRENDTPLNYSFNSISEGAYSPYQEVVNNMPEDYKNKYLDENGEPNEELKEATSDYLESYEGNPVEIFDKKFKKVLVPKQGADFVRNYVYGDLERDFDVVYKENTDSVELGTVGWNFVANTSSEDHGTFSDNPKLQEVMENEFGKDSFVTEVKDYDNHMSYSLDSTSEAAREPYVTRASNLDDPSKVLDSDGEFKPEFRKALNSHLAKEAEGNPVKTFFGKKLRKVADPYDSAKFIDEYVKK